MQHRVFGNTGLSVSPLGFGGAEIGYEGAAQADVSRLLNAALDAGLNVIDTAECYANSEELIGAAVSHRRREFHLFTKVGHENGPDDWSGASIARSIDRSLKRLRTDVLDLVQLHSCGVDVLAQGEAINALRKAREQGKTRLIGYSGDDRAALWAVRSGAFDTLQTSVSIADQQAITLTLPEAQSRGMGVIAKRPIANAAWRRESYSPSDYPFEYWKRLQELRYPFLEGTPAHGGGGSDSGQSGGGASGGAGAIGASGNADEATSSPAAIALRFTLAVPGVHTMIVGTKTPGRWHANARLIEAGPLDAQTFESIRNRWKQAAKDDWVGQI